MLIADLHIHSRYSRATSRELVPQSLDWFVRRKGIGLIGTGDFTHAAWRQELAQALRPAEDGLYTLAQQEKMPGALDGPAPRFVISGEISSIYKKNGKTRKIHNLILLPSLEAAEKISRKLEGLGANLHSDGRPILGLDSRTLLELTLDACPQAIFIPAHIWTPHFSLFGAYSGFDTIEECFEDLTPCIHALETGLSSDPPMNGRLSALDGYLLVSNSDAHSPDRLGREGNLLQIELSFDGLARALDGRDPHGLAGTLEFFPEEGKYHFDGHRACKVCLSPEQTRALGGVCPVCGKRITVGVLHRVEQLADRPEGAGPAQPRTFESLVPLAEVIAASTGHSPVSAKGRALLEGMLQALGPEFAILRILPLEDIARQAGPLVAEGIRRLRCGQVERVPGYDGEYGRVQLLSAQERALISGQISLFGEESHPTPCTGCRVTPPNMQDGRQAPARAMDKAPAPAGLAQDQLQAAGAMEGAIAVIAGPGTGKTRTLVERIARLIESGAPPQGITAVTFTNKAAREMRERLRVRLANGDALEAMTIGTFHAICLQKLSAAGRLPALASQEDTLAILTDIVKQRGIQAAPREVARRISLQKCGGQGEVPDGILQAYRAALDGLGAMDYDDILLRALDMPPEAPGGVLHLLVDEFQDVNPVQYALVRRWGEGAKSLFVIGDPDQAIYGFRGSDAACFTRFFADYPMARRITLAGHYRCTPQVLGCALSVIGQDGLPRALRAVRPDGARVQVVRGDGGFSEALFVVKEIGRLVGGIDMLSADGEGALGFNDIAVLYRTHHQAELLEHCLGQEGIPYRVAGREDFLMNADIRGALAWLAFAADPCNLLALRGLLGYLGLPGEMVMRYAAQPGRGGAALLDIAGDMGAGGAAREQLAQLMAGKISKKPVKALEYWINANHLQGNQALERLCGLAVYAGDVPGFLRTLSLGGEGDLMRSSTRRVAADAVTLMTLHAAKGLEFPVAFLIGLRDGLVPFRREGVPCDEAEERRLCYVGMTRARERLYLLTAPEVSPFLNNLPAGDIEYARTLPAKPYDGRQLSLL
nr:UvrD-helicase domain-containing protein [bacterium]